VAQIRGNGFVVQAFRRSGGSLVPTGCMGASVLLLLATSWVQAQSAPKGNSNQRNPAVTSAASPVTTQQVTPQPVTPPLRSMTSAPPPLQPPNVTWDGKQLTIDADNSSLADILAIVRQRTGATIEIPAAASGERVFVHVGPGPVRDILSDLFYGMPFDYIVEAAEDDPDTLRRVVLTARGQGDSSTDVVIAGATDTGEVFGSGSDARGRGATDVQTRSERVRMMPGWNSPGKPSFQAEAEAALAAAQAAAQDSAAPQDSASAQDSTPVQDSTPPQDSARVQDSAPAPDADGVKAANASPSSTDSGDQSGVGQQIQSMTRMFEQRRQIQAQQNQPPPPSSN